MPHIGFLCSDNSLYNGFKKIEQFQDFKILKSLTDTEIKDVDILIISDKFLSSNELIKDQEILSNINHVFYMISSENYNYSLEGILKANKIHVIPPRLTETQIILMVTSKVFGNIRSNDNVFVFFGADNKVGTTMVSQAVAERLSSLNDNLKILYTSFSGSTGVEYFSSAFPVGIDNIKVKLLNNLLNINEVYDACINVKNNLYVLKGTELFAERRHYHVKHVENFLNLIKNEFDIIIIDAGSNIELGLTIGSLRATNNKFLVATQQAKATNHYLSMETQVLSKLQIKDFMLIVNQEIQNNILPSPFSIAEQFKMTLLTTVPYLEYGWQCEKDHHTLLKYENKDYLNSIDKITKVMLQGISALEEKEEPKRSFFSRLLVGIVK